MTSDDLATIRRLLREAELPTDGLEEQFGPGYAVAMDEGAVIGAAGVERYGRFGLLRSVVVIPEARSRGAAELLVRDRLAWAGTEGLEAVYLLTTTAARYFGRLGFENVERDALPVEIRDSREFASLCPSTAVAMRRLV
ncbi:MAG: arsenic resistance N-acetyltransferase ArsN2 [Gemmatimonadales bacterium]